MKLIDGSSVMYRTLGYRLLMTTRGFILQAREYDGGGGYWADSKDFEWFFRGNNPTSRKELAKKYPGIWSIRRENNWNG